MLTQIASVSVSTLLFNDPLISSSRGRHPEGDLRQARSRYEAMAYYGISATISKGPSSNDGHASTRGDRSHRSMDLMGSIVYENHKKHVFPLCYPGYAARKQEDASVPISRLKRRPYLFIRCLNSRNSKTPFI